MNLLRRREQIPKVINNSEGDEMVVLLKEEEGKGANSKGRPVGPWVARLFLLASSPQAERNRLDLTGNTTTARRRSSSWTRMVSMSR